jgi:hypothetical protein
MGGGKPGVAALRAPIHDRQGAASCTESVFPTHLHLRLISHPIHPEGIALGVTHLTEDGLGFQADIFCDRVARLQHESQVDLAILLGIVMAHELLGTSSHSPAGIMRASWHREDLLHTVKGALLFTDDESDRSHESQTLPGLSRLPTLSNGFGVLEMAQARSRLINQTGRLSTQSTAPLCLQPRLC